MLKKFMVMNSNIRYWKEQILSRMKEGKEFKIEENLIITYSSKRAKKDKEDRERLVRKAKELLENKGSITALEKKKVQGNI